jgi:hypothetical protein
MALCWCLPVPGPGSFDWVTLMQEQMCCCFVSAVFICGMQIYATLKANNSHSCCGDWFVEG